MINKKIKCVVIGGNGFIGYHVAKQLELLGCYTKVIDLSSNANIKNLVVCDIKDYNKLKKELRGFDYVFNFAGIADIGEANKYPLKTINENIIGSSNIFEICAELKIKRVFFASTIYVYSKAGGFYKASKQALENILETYNLNYNLKFTILRYGSVYGLNAQPWNGINKYINAALKSQKIVCNGNGEEIREYINVIDAAKLTVSTLSKKFENSYVTISGINSIKTKDLFVMLEEILQKKITIKYQKSKRTNEHYLTTPYNFIPKKSVKIVPKEYIDLGEGLLEIISNYKK